MAICASCKARVDHGAVRCLGCGAVLSNPASFVTVCGWVLLALSSIPAGLGVVAEGEHVHVPLAIGIGVFVFGAVLLFFGRTRSKDAAPTTLPDEEAPETA